MPWTRPPILGRNGVSAGRPQALGCGGEVSDEHLQAIEEALSLDFGVGVGGCVRFPESLGFDLPMFVGLLVNVFLFW